jgi:hypothetical protein
MAPVYSQMYQEHHHTLTATQPALVMCDVLNDYCIDAACTLQLPLVVTMPVLFPGGGSVGRPLLPVIFESEQLALQRVHDQLQQQQQQQPGPGRPMQPGPGAAGARDAGGTWHRINGCSHGAGRWASLNVVAGPTHVPCGMVVLQCRSLHTPFRRCTRILWARLLST